MQSGAAASVFSHALSKPPIRACLAPASKSRPAVFRRCASLQVTTPHRPPVLSLSLSLSLHARPTRCRGFTLIFAHLLRIASYHSATSSWSLSCCLFLLFSQSFSARCPISSPMVPPVVPRSISSISVTHRAVRYPLWEPATRTARMLSPDHHPPSIFNPQPRF